MATRGRQGRHVARTKRAISRALRRFLAAVCTLLMACGSMLTVSFVAPRSADATVATGGSGRFLNDIRWATWGSHGFELWDGDASEETYTIAGRTVVVKCTLRNQYLDILPYRPGSFAGDGLDNLYNVGGQGTANTMSNGIIAMHSNTTQNYSIRCRATIDGADLPLRGVVVADAEQLAGGEYIQATPLAVTGNSTTWHALDLYRPAGCTSTVPISVTGSTMQIQPANPTCSAGPTAVTYAQYANPIPGGVNDWGYVTQGPGVSLQVKSGGLSAVAVGVMISADYSDSTLGTAGGLFMPGFAGSGLPQGTTQLSPSSLTSASAPTTRLGATTDGDPGPFSTTAANGDDLNSTGGTGQANDEDAFTASGIWVSKGKPYALTVPCVGGTVNGWIDWDRNGALVATEGATPVACSNGSATLTWTVPANQQEYLGTTKTTLRLRISSVASEVAAANFEGISTLGEAEDHAINVSLLPRITVKKDVSRANAADQFTVSATQSSTLMTSATTAGTATTATSNPAVVTSGVPVTLTDALAPGSVSPSSYYRSTISCTNNDANSSTVLPSGVGSTFTVTPVTNDDITCTFTNTGREVNVVKTTTGSITGPSVTTGEYSVQYNVSVVNSSTFATTYGPLTDTPAFDSNLTVTGATWTVAGPSAPPAGSATGAGPFTLSAANTALPASGTHTFTVTITFKYNSSTAAQACNGSGTGLFNSAALAVNQEQGSTADNSACRNAPSPPTAQLNATKSAVISVDNGQAGRADVNDVITYTVRVQNTGALSVDTVQAVDTMSAPADAVTLSCPTGTVAPGAFVDCTGTYTVTQPDVDAGAVRNTASASAKTLANNTTVTSAVSAEIQVPTANLTGLKVFKTARLDTDLGRPGVADVGDVVAYSFDIQNLGSRTVSNPTIADFPVSPATAPTGSVTCPNAIAPGQRVTCTGSLTYTTTQADVDTGFIKNESQATATDPISGSVTSSRTDPSSQASMATANQTSVQVLKTGAITTDNETIGAANAGDIVTYTFKVKNTGTVTLRSVTIADYPVSPAGTPTGTITCPGDIAPNATATCTGSLTYTVTQADVNNGAVRSESQATALGSTGQSVTSDRSDTSSQVSIATDSRTGIKVKKSATISTDGGTVGQADAADVLTYTFSVVNTGARTIYGPITLTDVQQGPATGATGTVTCNAPIAPGATSACTGQLTYTVTLADVNAGSIRNAATVTGQDPVIGTISSNAADPDSKTSVYTAQRPGLEVKKKATITTDQGTVGKADLNDQISYTFEVRNSGSVTLSNVTVADFPITPAGAPTGTITCPSTLDPATTFTACTGSLIYTVTQADVDNGQITNESQASAASPGGATVTSDRSDPGSQASVPAASIASITVLKSAVLKTDNGTVGMADVDDVIKYDFTMKNSGTVTLHGPYTLTDLPQSPATLPTGSVTCNGGDLAPGVTRACTSTMEYTVTQADVNAGRVLNKSQVAAKDPANATVTSNPNDLSAQANVLTANRTGLKLEKKATIQPDTGTPGVVDIGDTIVYSFDVTNTGSRTVTIVTVTDTMTAPASAPNGTVSCPATLEPGVTVTCSGVLTYTVSQADIDAGGVSNTATATARDPIVGTIKSDPGDPTSKVTVPSQSTSGIQVIKTAVLTTDMLPTGTAGLNDVISYTFQVKNTGARTLQNAAISDAMQSPAGGTTGGPITCPTSIAPGDTVSCTGTLTYTVTQKDVDAGSVVNSSQATATAAGNGPVSSNPSDPAASTITPTTVANSLSIVKQGIVDGGTAGVGETVSYRFTVKNTGSQTLTLLKVMDDSVAPAVSPTVTCAKETIGPLEEVLCTATTQVTQADLDAGGLRDRATAQATAPGGQLIQSPVSADVMIPADAANYQLSLEKSATIPGGTADVGETISYSFKVTNQGNRTFSDPIVIDTMTAPAGTVDVSCPSGPIAPQSFVTCTGTYQVTQADLDAGGISNTATASAKNVPPVTTNNPTVVPVTDSNAYLSIVKTAKPGSSPYNLGQVITYEYVVTANGNRTAKDIEITDVMEAPADPIWVSCPSNELAPGASMTCQGLYTVTQHDMDHGVIHNTATASSSTAATGTSAQVEVTAAPGTYSLTLSKAARVNGGSFVKDETIEYTYTVTATGNRSVTGIAITDTMTSPAGPVTGMTCRSTTVSPGSPITCTASYVATQADVDKGSIINSATVVGDQVTTPVPSNTVTVTAENPNVRLTISKDHDPVTGTATAGETITYRFVVTSVGTQTATNIKVVDQFAPPASPATINASCPATSLAPPNSMTCTATYTVRQADMDNGGISNRATVSADGFTSDPTPNYTVAADPPTYGLSVTKTASVPGGKFEAGETVTFDIAVNATGNRTVDSLALTDVMTEPSGHTLNVQCPQTSVTPGIPLLCSALYQPTQADFDRGQLINSVQVSGTHVSAVSSAPVTVLAEDPVYALAISKSATVPGGTFRLGESITFPITITATGNHTVSDVVVSDTMTAPAGQTLSTDCSVMTVEPGTPRTCSATYAPTQADLDRGYVENTATVSGTNVSSVTSAPVRANADPADYRLGISKTAAMTNGDPTYAVDEEITFTIVITAEGNRTVSDVSVSDALQEPSGPTPAVTCPATTVTPGTPLICSAKYRTNQADMDRGYVSNKAMASATGVSPVSSTVATINADAPIYSVTATKSGSVPGGTFVAGETVSYQIVVSANGNRTVNNVQVTDTMVAPAGHVLTPSCPRTQVTPGAPMTCVASYVATQADVERGSIINRSRVSADGATSADSNEFALDAAPATYDLKLTKSASVPDGTFSAGEPVTFTLVVEAVGNRIVTGVAVTDAMVSPAGTVLPVSCGSTTVTPGTPMSCTTTYTPNQADVDRGYLDNAAIVTSAQGTSATSNIVRVTAVAATYELAVAKSVSVPGGTYGVGETLTYTMVVSATGTRTVTGVEVTDVMVAPAGKALSVNCGGVTAVTPGVPITCTATYLATIADMDRGTIANQAFATGAAVTQVSSNTVTSSAEPATTGLKVTKKNRVIGGADKYGPGSVVNFDVTVEATGNRSVADVLVTDIMLQPAGKILSVDCPAETVSPGTPMLCTTSYTVTQNDIDTGYISNVAYAEGTGVAKVSSPPTDVAAADPVRTWSIAKTATLSTDNGATGVADLNDVVSYTVTVTNTGNRSISDPVVKDTMTSPAGAVNLVCTGAPVDPGKAMTCTANYTVTQADVDTGQIENVASASLSQWPTIDSGPATRVPTVTGSNAVSLVKSALISTDTGTTGRADVGDVVTYTYAVTNNGNQTLTDIKVTDVMAAPAESVSVTCTPNKVAPGATVNCTGTHTVTQADLDAGGISNTANVSAKAPDGTLLNDAVTSPVTVPVSEPLTALTLAKSAAMTTDLNNNGMVDANDVITYTFEIAATGNRTVTDIVVTDTPQPPAGAVEVGCPTTSIAPGTSLRCKGTYTVTDADLGTGGYLTDTATVSGVAAGNPVTAISNKVDIELAPVKVLKVVKSAAVTSDANQDGVADVGDQLTFTVTVTNTGHFEVTDVRVDDTLKAPAGPAVTVTCTPKSLLPGQTATCTATPYTVTEADADAGVVVNVAVGHARTLVGMDVSSSDADQAASSTVPLQPTPQPTPKPTSDRPKETPAPAPVRRPLHGALAVTGFAARAFAEFGLLAAGVGWWLLTWSKRRRPSQD